MSTKPSTLPEWNTGGANRTTPSPTRKVLGWLLGERPAGSYFNFLFYWIFKWVEYLKEGAIVADVNNSITVSGTGRYKHGDDELPIQAGAFQVVAVASQWAAGTVPEFDGTTWTFGTSTASLIASVPLPPGKRIKSINWTFSKGGNAVAMAMSLKKRTGTTTSVLNTLSDVTSGAGVVTTASSAINYTVESGYRLWLQVSPGNAAHAFEGANIIFDHP